MPLNGYYEGFPLDSAEIFKSNERISLIMPDREAATLEKWLKEHAGVEIISRDRGGPYAEGVNGRRKLPLSEQILAAFCSILRDLEFP